MKKRVADYIADFLADHGIRDCFMVTGGGAMHLDDALGHSDRIRVTFNHHEQASAIAAEGYARLTGRMAVVCVTSGPGGVNAMTGVMGAWQDSIPMVVLSGQVKRETLISAVPDLGLRQLGDQEFDIENSVRNMTKYVCTVRQPEMIACHLEKAFYLAEHGRKGPVWLDIPLDVQGATVETDTLCHFHPEKEMPWQAAPVLKKETVDLVREKLRNAKAPLILAGTGIRLAGAEDEFLTFVRNYRIPVITAWNANDTIAFDSPYYAGMPGTVGTRAGNFALQNADVLLSLGCRMNLRLIGYTHHDFAKNAFKISVDIDGRELMKPTVEVDLPVHGDVKDFLQKMNQRQAAGEAEKSKQESARISDSRKKFAVWCHDLVKKYPVVRPEMHGKEKLNPYVFLDDVFSVLAEKPEKDDQIVCGNGSACVMTFQAAKLCQGQRMFTNSGCAAMGYGLPAAIGAAVAEPKKRTICVDGDGSIMMNLQELATVVYHHLNLKIILLNNNGYLSIRQTQRNLFQPPFIGIDRDSGIGFPDFGKLADAFGIPYRKVDREDGAMEQLREDRKSVV